MRYLASAFVFIASFALVISPRPSLAEPTQETPAVYNGLPGLKQLLPTFDFKGGSVTEFVNALREASRPQDLNIIVLDPMPDIKIAPVKLRNISVESALILLRGPLTSAAVNAEWIVPESAWDNPVVYIKRPNTVAAELSQRAAQEKRRTTAVLSLQLGRPRSEDERTKTDTWASIALDAIEQALSTNVQPGNLLPTVRYHSSSSLLFVTGEPSELAIAREVVDRIAQDIRDAKKAAKAEDDISQLREQLDDYKKREVIAKAEAAKPEVLIVEVAAANRMAVRRAIESVMLRVVKSPGQSFTISEQDGGLRIAGDRELVLKAALIARGAKFALADNANSEERPSEAK